MLMQRFWLFAIACSLPLSARAQAPAPAGNANGAIHLNVVVLPQHGDDPVAELPESAFSVTDNGKPAPITSFHAFSQPNHAHIILVVDAVNVPYSQLAYERNELDKYLKSNEGQLPQPTALAVMTDTSNSMTGFTTDGNSLSKVLAQKEIGLREVNRSAGFYGAEERLDISLRALRVLTEQAQSIPGHKAMIWLSPGWPLLSGPAIQLTGKQEDALFHQVEAVTNVLRQCDVTLYTVNPFGAQQSVLREFYYQNFLKGVTKPSQVMPGNLGLQVSSVQSGGQVLTGSNDLAGEIARVVKQTVAFYELSYDRPPADGPDQYHKIDVKLANPGMNAHTTQGYYSSPE